MTRSRLVKFIVVTAVTLGRVPLILVFLLVTLLQNTQESPLWFSVALGAMALSALTDTIDGYLARRFKVESSLGAYADPLSDKIFYVVTLPTLVFLACGQREIEGAVGDLGAGFHARVLVVMTILFLLRDQWISFLRSMGALHKISARANWSGKVRTGLAFPVICVIYYYLQAPEGYLFGLMPLFKWPFLVYIAEGLCMVINLVSIWVYTTHYWPALRREANRAGKGDEG